MVGLYEGGNEPPGSLKAIFYPIRKDNNYDENCFTKYGLSTLHVARNGPEVHSASYKIEYRVKGGQSMVPTTPPQSSAEAMESMGALPPCPQVHSWHVIIIIISADVRIMRLDLQFKLTDLQCDIRRCARRKVGQSPRKCLDGIRTRNVLSLCLRRRNEVKVEGKTTRDSSSSYRAPRLVCQWQSGEVNQKPELQMFSLGPCFVFVEKEWVVYHRVRLYFVARLRYNTVICGWYGT
ncbi:hypothetical protein ANN_18649, partial [Periplaneta americana]